MTLNTVAFELVPPNADLGPEQAVEEARKVLRFSKEAGIDGQIGHVMIPGMIEEDDDRPVEMKPRMDVLDFWNIIKPELPGMRGLCAHRRPVDIRPGRAQPRCDPDPHPRG